MNFPELQRGRADYLPNFCGERAVLAVVVSAELLAVVIAVLLEARPGAGFLVNIGLISVYVQWIALVCAALLCALRRNVSFRSSRTATLVALAIILGSVAVVSEIAWQIDRQLKIVYVSTGHLEFMAKSLVIALIIGGLLLRNFFLQHARQLSIARQAAAQLEAMHARIRPHFLFNTLNAIISITHADPQKTESALHDLAELMRAALRMPDDFISLAEELEIVRMYARIEKLRLGERLQLQIDLSSLSSPARSQQVPGLILQPLVENAVYHGIEQIAEGGSIVLTATEDDEQITIVVSNDYAGGVSRSGSGQHLGLDNVRQRLELAFGERAELDTTEGDGKYTCAVTIPKIVPSATASA